MKEMIIQALKTKLLGEMNGHIANIEVMTTNPVGVGDHPNVMETVQAQIDIISQNKDRLNVLQEEFRGED